MLGATLALCAAAALPLLSLASASPNVIALDTTRDGNKANSFAARQQHDTSRRLQHASRRADRLGRRQAKVSEQTLSYDAGTLFYLNLTVGSPPQSLAAYLDTGSSDLWMPSTAAASTFCSQAAFGCGGLGGFDSSRSSSYKTLAAMGAFEIQYGDGTQISGKYFTDDLSVGAIRLTNATMALATAGKELYPINAIFGVGYDLNEAYAQQAGQAYFSVVDNMQKQGAINTKAYSLFMNDLSTGSGTVIFGGVDTAKYHGALGVLPLLPDFSYALQSAASGAPNPGTVVDAFWIALTGLAYANATKASPAFPLGQNAIPVLLDSGTSLTYLPDATVAAIYTALGVRIDATFGPLIACGTPTASANLTYTFSGLSLAVPLAQLIIPFTAAELKGTAPPRFADGGLACQFGIMGAGDSGSGLEGTMLAGYILGDTFLSSAYVVYDLSNNVVALAPTNFNATSSAITAIASTIPAGSVVPSPVSPSYIEATAAFATALAGSPPSAAGSASASRVFSVPSSTGVASRSHVAVSPSGAATPLSGPLASLAFTAVTTGSPLASGAVESLGGGAGAGPGATSAAAAAGVLRPLGAGAGAGFGLAAVAVLLGMLGGGGLVAWL